jgi:hypothetical protein
MPYAFGYNNYGTTAPVASGYYNYGTTAPVAPTGTGATVPAAATSGAVMPVSPYQYLSGYDPDAPVVPAGAGTGGGPSAAQSLGARILSGLRVAGAAVWNDRGALLQTAINIFGATTGFSPVIQDVMVLAKMADKVFQEFQAGRGPSASPTNQQGATPAPGTNLPGTTTAPGSNLPGGAIATITFTVTVQSNGQVTVNQQGGAATNAPAGNPPSTNPPPPNPPPANPTQPPSPGSVNQPGQTPNPNKKP